MPGFLYYLPNARDASDATLAEYGLSHIIDQPGQVVIPRQVLQHPCGHPGQIVGAQDCWAEEEVKQSEAVEWVKFPKAYAQRQAWLGWYKASGLPKPEDLRRKTGTIPGELIRLADGHQWEVPIARDTSGNCLLPRAYDLDDETGEWISTRVRREYDKLWQHAMSYYESLMDAVSKGEKSFVIPDGELLVADALAVNYRVSMRELATLGVLVTGIVQVVADVIMDQHDNLKKKSAADAGSGSSG